MWRCLTLVKEKGKNWDPLATNSVCGTSWELWMRARGRNWWRHDNTALTIFLHPTRNFLTTKLFEWNWNAAKLLENTFEIVKQLFEWIDAIKIRCNNAQFKSKCNSHIHNLYKHPRSPKIELTGRACQLSLIWIECTAADIWARLNDKRGLSFIKTSYKYR